MVPPGTYDQGPPEFINQEGWDLMVEFTIYKMKLSWGALKAGTETPDAEDQVNY
jgi:hypothetical protein